MIEGEYQLKYQLKFKVDGVIRILEETDDLIKIIKALEKANKIINQKVDKIK